MTATRAAFPMVEGETYIWFSSLPVLLASSVNCSHVTTTDTALQALSSIRNTVFGIGGAPIDLEEARTDFRGRLS